MVAGPNIIDFITVLLPIALCGYLGVRGLLPVFKGKFAIVTIAMFIGATAIALLLSFASFALITVMDDSITASAASAAGASTGTNQNVVSAGTFLVPVAKFLARSRFVRSVLVAFLQPSLLSVAGIACCLMLVYVREALVRMGADVMILLEHFAVFSQADAAK